MTHFRVADAEALAVLIRYADCVGEKVTQVVPINSYFAVSVTGTVEVTNDLNLDPFCEGVDRQRTYWQEIVEVVSDSLALLN